MKMNYIKNPILVKVTNLNRYSKTKSIFIKIDLTLASQVHFENWKIGYLDQPYSTCLARYKKSFEQAHLGLNTYSRLHKSTYGYLINPM